MTENVTHQRYYRVQAIVAEQYEFTAASPDEARQEAIRLLLSDLRAGKDVISVHDCAPQCASCGFATGNSALTDPTGRLCVGCYEG